MSSTRLRALLLGSAGCAVLLLLSVANSSSSPEVERRPNRRSTVVVGPEKAVVGVNPFRTPIKPTKQTQEPSPTIELSSTPVGPLPGVADVAPQAVKVELPAPESMPDLKVEGVVMGADPVAVIRSGSDSFVLRVGESFGDGFKVTAIGDSQVRIERMGKEYILKTSG